MDYSVNPSEFYVDQNSKLSQEHEQVNREDHKNQLKKKYQIINKLKKLSKERSINENDM